MYETRKDAPLPRPRFTRRLAKHVAIALGLITYVPWISLVGVDLFLRR